MILNLPLTGKSVKPDTVKRIGKEAQSSTKWQRVKIGNAQSVVNPYSMENNCTPII